MSDDRTLELSTENARDSSMSEKYRTNPFFNGVSTFKSAFPDLMDAVVEWRELRGPDDPRTPEHRKTGYRRGNFTQGILPCSNPACHEGGYQVDRLIADMLNVGEAERSGTMLCSGRETGEEVRRGPVRCPHRMLYRATLTFRTDESPPEREDRGEERRSRGRGRGRNRGGRRRHVA
jgi:hypothetical protein